MSVGTLYVKERARCVAPIALIKYFDLDIRVEAAENSEAYEENFPLQKVPTFIGSNGFKLHETIALSMYLIELGDPSSELLGKTPTERAEISKWASFANTEVLPTIINLFLPFWGEIPYDEDQSEKGHIYLETVIDVLEQWLENHTYLVSERLTFADVFGASSLLRGYEFFFGKAWRHNHPNTHRWFLSIYENKILHDVVGEIKYLENPVQYEDTKA